MFGASFRKRKEEFVGDRSICLALKQGRRESLQQSRKTSKKESFYLSKLAGEGGGGRR